ncbi:MAG: tetratricopeptide repeat protein [Deltaproteobacteria bacterium]|nr:tetratricopeptide repeat protein [Deltaproteobacteria bacterium]
MIEPVSPTRAPRAGLLLAVALALTAAAYAEAPRGPFVWDDWSLIHASPAIREGGPLRTILLGPFWTRSATAPAVFSYYRPLVSASYAVDWWISGGAPGWFHVVNVLLHLGCVALVFALGRRAGAGPAGAALAATLFGLAPRLAESAAWISGRTDLWASLFALLALLLHDPGPGGGRRRALAAVALFLGLCGKEVAVAALAGLVAMEAESVRREGRSRSAAARGLVPGGLALGAYLVLRAGALERAVPAGTPLSLPGRLSAALQALGTYLTMLLDPLRPELLVGNLARREPALIALGVAAALGLAAGAVLAVRRGLSPPRAALLVTSLCALGLVLHLVPLAVTVVAADRFLYLPLAALAPAAAGAASGLRPGARRMLAALALASVPLFGLALRQRVAEWADPEALWRAGLARSGGEPLAHLELGNVLFRARRHAEALPHYRAAAQGTVGQLHAAALGNLASTASELGRYDEARETTLGLVALEPDLALHRYNLAVIEARRLDLAAAAARLAEALRLQPDYPEALAARDKLAALGAELARLGPEAAGEPTAVRAARASLWARLGRDREAVALHGAVARAPDASPRALLDAAAYLARLGDPAEGRAALERAEAAGASGPELAAARRALEARRAGSDLSGPRTTSTPEIPGR